MRAGRAAGRHVHGSASKISRIEGGQVGIKEDDLHELLTLYQVTDANERRACCSLCAA